MFREHKCGCIWSIEQGRVRMCDMHRIETADGYGGLAVSALKGGVVRNYPANGTAVLGWKGGK